MNEAIITKNLRKAIEKIMPITATLLRHVDMTQTGIPDLSYHYGGRTTWFEIKYIGPDGKIKQSALQKRNILKLSQGAKLRYVVFIFGVGTEIVTADRMREEFYPNKNWSEKKGTAFGYAHIAQMMLNEH